MLLTEKEKKYINDSDFLTTKSGIFDKIHKQFEITRSQIKSIIEGTNFSFPENTDTEYGKIFKGEYYRSLPYLVLDYPKLFTNENIFTYRTMFWWGNFFSSTLHIEGEYLKKNRSNIINNVEVLIKQKTYLSVGKTPWEYHYESNNYQLANLENIHTVNECKFLKLSKKIELDDFDNLPKFSKDFFSFLLNILSD